MRFNRFLDLPTVNKNTPKPVTNRFQPARTLKNGWGRASSAPNTNTSPTCTQVNEEPVDGDLFVLDVLELFFKERLPSVALNDALKQTAAYAVDQANQLIPAGDTVPRPANGSPTASWLVADAVQMAFRKAQNKCLYHVVRNVVSQRLRTQYERDKEAAQPLSNNQSYFSSGLGVNNLSASQAGIDLIKGFENFRANLYNDSAGHCTIGYGTLAHHGNCNGSESEEFKAGITEARAVELLMTGINSVVSTVNAAVQVALNQNQFDALVSFVYNIGSGAFRRSTLLRKLNEGNYADVPTELRKWIKADGKTSKGLVSRRNAEIEVFNRPISSAQSVRGTKPCGCQAHEKSYGARMLALPRGIRNNNPGNIEMSDANAWQGKVPRAQNTDGRFEQFTSYAYGVRALIILLRNYIQHNKNTLTTIFGAYAPPSENNTQSYIRFVSERIGLSATERVPLTRNNLKVIAQAIARMENGQEAITDAQFDEGWALLSPEVANSIQQSPFSISKETPFFDVRTCTPDALFNSNWTRIKNQIVTTARGEYDFWTKPNGAGRFSETEAQVTQRLQEYWGSVDVHPTAAQLQSAAWQENNPWSAAFISWVMVQAGATPHFAKGIRHTIYASAAKQNAENRNFDNPFWLCRVNNALPDPGDLVVKNRKINGVMSHITYDSLSSTGSSHSDIVTSVDYTQGTITVMGGNKHGNTVNTETYTLNGNGTIDTTRHPEVFGILKLRTDKCEVCGISAVV